MESYRLSFKRSVTKDFRSIPQEDVRRILSRIDALAPEPRPKDCQKLTGQERYRVRVGRYRIVYEIRDEVLLVIVVAVAQWKGV